MLLGANEASLYLYHPERDVLEWAARIGPKVAPIGTALRRGEGLSGKIWETGKALIVDEYDGWKGHSTSWTGCNVAVVGVPIRWRPADAAEEFLGVLTITKAVPQTFSEDDAELLERFAARAAIAIKNARLFETEREQREFAKALDDAAAAVGSTLDLDQVLDIILEQVARIVRGDTFNIMLVEDENARVVRWRGYEEIDPDDQVSRFLAPIASFPSLTRMAQTGKPSTIPDTAADPEWVKLEGRE